jgi:phage N-6-adenine-methyltransferase
MAPAQKPHRSVQTVQTPPELLTAIADEFHVVCWARDLAATEDNSVASVPSHYYGPASELGENSLASEWPAHGDLWLNPPFSKLEPWVKKCSEQRNRVGRIFVLLPAAVGSNWFLRYVYGRAHVVLLTPRVTFTGHSAPYPKDVLLANYSSVQGGTSHWRWKP